MDLGKQIQKWDLKISNNNLSYGFRYAFVHQYFFKPLHELELSSNIKHFIEMNTWDKVTLKIVEINEIR